MTEFDGTTHFNALLSNANLHAAFPFRSITEINAHTVGSTPNPWITFDPSMNAAKVVTPPGDGVIDAGIPSAAQLRPTYPLVDKTTGENEISLQWEARWSSDFLDVTSQNLTNQKSFQIGREDGGGERRRVQLDVNFSRTDATAVGTPSIRVYVDGPIGGDGIPNVLRTAQNPTPGWNHQPGGPGYTTWNSINSASDHLQAPDGPFLLLPDKWIRFTASLTFTGGEQRLRVWMQHEDEQAPTLVIADPADTSQGFLIDGTGNLHGTDNFWFEYNSSSVRPVGTPPLVAWFRNLVVFQNQTVPLTTGDAMPEPPPHPPPPQSQTFTIHIAPEPNVGQPTIVTELPPAGQIGQPYSHTFRAIRGVQPYRWMSSGQFPPGLSLQFASKPNEAILSGTPASSGDWTITIWPENARPDVDLSG